MKPRAILVLPFLALSPSDGVSERLQRERIEAITTSLSSDELEGRGAGYPGEERAATLIARAFADAGLAPAGEVTESGRSYLQPFRFPATRPERAFEVLGSRNVVGYLEGADETLRSEILVVGAHHDGVGMSGQADPGRREVDDAGDGICNAANDNASSVAVLIEVARSIASASERPKRSLVFVTFGAEEHALNGSVQYVSDPPFELSRHVAMINLEKLGGSTELVTASTSTSPRFGALRERVNARSDLHVASIVDELITDTDHFPFALRGVPAMVLGTAGTEHVDTPRDSVEKIDMDLLVERGQYVAEFVLEAANAPGAFAFVADETPFHGALVVPLSAAERVEIGLDAVKVSAVVPGCPAARAGLRPSDVVLRIDGRELGGLEDFRDALPGTPGSPQAGSPQAGSPRAGSPRAGSPQEWQVRRGAEELRLVLVPR